VERLSTTCNTQRSCLNVRVAVSHGLPPPHSACIGGMAPPPAQGQYWCQTCDVNIAIHNRASHERGARHRGKASANASSSRFGAGQDAPPPSQGQSRCQACNVNVPNANRVQHELSVRHQANMARQHFAQHVESLFLDKGNVHIACSLGPPTIRTHTTTGAVLSLANVSCRDPIYDPA
jgi:hypothetical protein